MVAVYWNIGTEFSDLWYCVSGLCKVVRGDDINEESVVGIK